MTNTHIDACPTQHLNFRAQHLNFRIQHINFRTQHINYVRFITSLCFLLGLTIFSSSPVYASNKTSDILSALSRNIKSAPSIRMEFDIYVSSSNDSYSGTVLAAGNSYKLVNPQFELYCDGESKWMVNHTDREITVFQHDASQTDIVENPLGFFTSIGNSYNFAERSWKEFIRNVNPVINGKEVWMVNLKPKNSRAPYKTIKLGIDTNNNQPVIVVYTSRDNSVFTIVVKKFVRLEQPLPQSTFKLPKSTPSGYKTNDLR